MIVSVAAALAASLSWTTAALLAHAPARSLGAFEFTRIQLVSAAAILAMLATATGAWATVSWAFWPAYLTASLGGVIVGNLAMTACLRRGGPRRLQLLEAAAGPLSALLAWSFLGERFTAGMILSGGMVMAGIVMAIAHGGGRDRHDLLTSPLAVVVALGLISALAQAVGLVAMKPVLDAGADPIAASAIRTGLAGIIVSLIGLWPRKRQPPDRAVTPATVAWTIAAGILGYVVAVSLLLVALKFGNTGVAAVLGSLSPVMMLPIIWRISRRPPWQAWAGAAMVVLGLATMFVKL